MKYMGSKARIAKEILQIVLKDRKPNQWYVEPFAGGMNIIDKVNGNRIANDANKYLIAMWNALVNGSWVPFKIDKAFHKDVRLHKDNYPAHIVGWVGFNCSYSGVFFGGYAGETKTKINTIRDYQQEAINNVMQQVPKLQGVIFENKNYEDVVLPENSIIYCDPPYEGVSGYKTQLQFDHSLFWQWVRTQTHLGHTIYISEYNAPSDFVCVWEKQVKSSLSANGKAGASKLSTEKLFTYIDK